MEEPLVNKIALLEKFPGKGGWTFTRIPEIPPAKHSYFGWVTVRGTIDEFKLNNYKLMPMGNGQLFLPVRAEIRKAIGKKDGDWVRIVLYNDNLIDEIPGELLVCLEDEPTAHQFFLSLSELEQKAITSWVRSAKNEDEKIIRLATTIDLLLNGKKLPKKNQGRS